MKMNKIFSLTSLSILCVIGVSGCVNSSSVLNKDLERMTAKTRPEAFMKYTPTASSKFVNKCSDRMALRKNLRQDEWRFLQGSTCNGARVYYFPKASAALPQSDAKDLKGVSKSILSIESPVVKVIIFTSNEGGYQANKSMFDLRSAQIRRLITGTSHDLTITFYWGLNGGEVNGKSARKTLISW
ncbi:hypothetical protein V6259_12545 [Marinomonas sp. TI.3.20]|uniref:hypothetical protein n=1 Tax=Marinomonas sp. TI.3.20 TaxID=3121296 RepID=UPI00311F2493